MARASWNGAVIAESDTTQELDGAIYFPRAAVKEEFFQPSDHKTYCGWKGEASYYTLVVEGKENENAAWSYVEPKSEASVIADHVAFWKGVEVEA